jgi:uncharacterized membrane protein YjdF
MTLERTIPHRWAWAALAIDVVFLFAGLFTARYDFAAYTIPAFILFFFILWLNRTYRFSHILWWGLAIWTLGHLAGGFFLIGSNRLYETVIVPLVGAPYNVIEYDQPIHVFGSIIITVLLIEILRKKLPAENWTKQSFLLTVALAGLGIGACYEIMEFFVTVITPHNLVGGYQNNLIDIICDAIGSVIAVIWLRRTTNTSA